jgi:hypothetical protein
MSNSCRQPVYKPSSRCNWIAAAAAAAAVTASDDDDDDDAWRNHPNYCAFCDFTHDGVLFAARPSLAAHGNNKMQLAIFR